MTTEQIHVSFGQFLKSARKTSGIDLHALSEKTKISLKVLRQIESEEHGALPDPAFVRGFLRLYAAAVGVDGDRTIELYWKSRGEYERMLAMTGDGYSNGGRFWMNMLLSLGALGGIMALSMVIISDSGIPKRVVEPLDYSVEAVSPSDFPDPGGESATGVETPSESAAMKKMILTVNAVEETWLKVIIDEQAAKEYKLKRGERLELLGGVRFNLMIGDAAAVKLALNGNPVVFHAKSGQLVALDLP